MGALYQLSPKRHTVPLTEISKICRNLTHRIVSVNLYVGEMKPPDAVAISVPPQLAGEYVDRDPPLVPRPPNGLQNGVVEPLEDGVGEALREFPVGHELCEGVEEGGAERSLPVEEVHLAGDVGDGGRCHGHQSYDYDVLAGQRTLESNDEIEPRGTEGTDATATAIWAIKGLDGGPTIHQSSVRRSTSSSQLGPRRRFCRTRRERREREGREGYQFDPRKHQQCPRGEQEMDGDEGGKDGRGGKKGEETDRAPRMRGMAQMPPHPSIHVFLDSS